MLYLGKEHDLLVVLVQSNICLYENIIVYTRTSPLTLDCAILTLRNLEIAQQHCAISRLRSNIAQSRDWHAISGFRECAAQSRDCANS